MPGYYLEFATSISFQILISHRTIDALYGVWNIGSPRTTYGPRDAADLSAKQDNIIGELVNVKIVKITVYIACALLEFYAA